MLLLVSLPVYRSNFLLAHPLCAKRRRGELLFRSRFYRAMLCMRGTVFVSLSVRLSVSVTSWSSTDSPRNFITN